MIIKPRVRGFMCITTHPVGCEANVVNQINYVKAQSPIEMPKRWVLVIGSSTGYGLAARISAAFGGGASTPGIFSENQALIASRVLLVGTNSAFHKMAEQGKGCMPKVSMATHFLTK